MTKKKKGFGSILKGLVFEQSEDEFDNEEMVIEPIKESKKSEQIPESTEAKIDEEVLQLLTNTLDDANLEGYDFYEFMKAVGKQKDPSEKINYQTVFSIVCDMGVTTDKLLKTADHYTNVLNQHKKEFQKTYETELQTQVHDLERQAESIENEITLMAEKIEVMKKLMSEKAEEKLILLEKAKTNAESINKIAGNYIKSHEMFVGQISSGKEKVSKYLAEGQK